MPAEEQANAISVGGELLHCRVTLRIKGETLDPEEITRLLGADPTRSRKKGDIRPHPRWHIEERAGSWQLESSLEPGIALEQHINTLLDKVTSDLSVWTELAVRFGMDLYCGLFLDSWNRGLELSPETLQRITERHLTLGLDIYSDWTDDEVGTWLKSET